jgi:hypothetical protein
MFKFLLESTLQLSYYSLSRSQPNLAAFLHVQSRIGAYVCRRSSRVLWRSGAKQETLYR